MGKTGRCVAMNSHTTGSNSQYLSPVSCTHPWLALQLYEYMLTTKGHPAPSPTHTHTQLFSAPPEEYVYIQLFFTHSRMSSKLWREPPRAQSSPVLVLCPE